MFTTFQKAKYQQKSNRDVINAHLSVSNQIDEQKNSLVDKYTEVCSSFDSTSSDVNKDVLKLKQNNIS